MSGRASVEEGSKLSSDGTADNTEVSTKAASDNDNSVSHSGSVPAQGSSASASTSTTVPNLITGPHEEIDRVDDKRLSNNDQGSNLKDSFPGSAPAQ